MYVVITSVTNTSDAAGVACATTVVLLLTEAMAADGLEKLEIAAGMEELEVKAALEELDDSTSIVGLAEEEEAGVLVVASTHDVVLLQPASSHDAVLLQPSPQLSALVMSSIDDTTLLKPARSPLSVLDESVLPQESLSSLPQPLLAAARPARPSKAMLETMVVSFNY